MTHDTCKDVWMYGVLYVTLYPFPVENPMQAQSPLRVRLFLIFYGESKAE